MNVIHYTPIIKHTDGSIDMTVVKKVEFKNLKPYGKFKLSTAKNPKNLPNIIPVDELEDDYNKRLTLTPEQDKEIVKMMKAGKSDILCENDGYLSFYTRLGSGFAHVYHKKLVQYREGLAFKAAVDGGDSFASVILNNMK